MTKFDAVGIRMAKEQALPIDADGLLGLAGDCGAAFDSNTSNTGKLIVRCLVSEKKLTHPMV